MEGRTNKHKDQGGTRIGKKDPGSIFFLRPFSTGLTNYVIRHKSIYSNYIKLRSKSLHPNTSPPHCQGWVCFIHLPTRFRIWYNLSLLTYFLLPTGYWGALLPPSPPLCYGTMGGMYDVALISSRPLKYFH